MLINLDVPFFLSRAALPYLQKTAGRIADPEDVAALILFLASDAARHVTGTAIPIDGGESA